MEKQEILESNPKIKLNNISNKASLSKKEIILIFIKSGVFLLLGFLLGSAKMPLETSPLGFALLASCNAEAPFVLLGIAASAFEGANLALSLLVGASVLIVTRVLSSLFLDKKSGLLNNASLGFFATLEIVFSESVSLRVMSSAIGVFLVGVLRIVEGGFRFYDLFSSILYLVVTPFATFLFSKYFCSFLDKSFTIWTLQ